MAVRAAEVPGEALGSPPAHRHFCSPRCPCAIAPGAAMTARACDRRTEAELFAACNGTTCRPLDRREAGATEFQHLVAEYVAVGVVDCLKCRVYHADA